MTDEADERGAAGRRTAGADGEAAAPRASIGQYLARQRELRGISIEELCARTKLPRRNIERLESGALDGQPDGFVRGFVRTIADALGLDADEAVMRLMHEPEADDEIAAAAEGRTRLYRLGAAVLGLVLVALLGSAVVRWLGQPEELEVLPEADSGVTYRVDVVRDLARDAEERPTAEARPAAEGLPPSNADSGSETPTVPAGAPAPAPAS